MDVVLFNTPQLTTAVIAARTCTDSIESSDTEWGDVAYDGLGFRDEKMLKRILKIDSHLNPPHESVIEHMNYTFSIKDISRACLMELTRHRHASYSVKSTRYTLKKIKKATVAELREMTVHVHDVQSDNDLVALLHIRDLLYKGSSPDEAKYSLPESFKTDLIMTINARSLRNFFALRTSKRALKEIRTLAYEMYDKIPDRHKFMFEDMIHPEE